MTWAVLACVLLIALTTVIHYEALRLLQRGLPRLRIPSRNKLLVVMAVAFAAHLLEMAVYGLAMYGLIHGAGLGTLSGAPHTTLESCLYFSAETYTSLGFGDLTPQGPVRLLAGAEALNGLLLIGWTASFTYLAMERFWQDGDSAAL